MDPSLILLICGCIALVISLLTGFFGYKLARFLLPLSGLAVVEGLLYIYVYDLLTLDAISTWLFFGGTIVAVYLILFFVDRLAGFFTGLAGSALLLTYLVYAFNLHEVGLIYPIVLTLCMISGLLAAYYRKAGVIVATSVLGGCASSFLGLYAYFQGVDYSVFAEGNFLVPLESFLLARPLLIGGIGLSLTLLCLVVQFFVTGKNQVLPSRPNNGTAPRRRRKERAADDDQTWTGDMGY